MLITEMFEDDKFEYVDPSDDNSIPKLDDLRKTKLTLGSIKKLRKYKETREAEKKSELKRIKAQYGATPEAEGGGF